jgi:hypothetical protein
MLIAPAIAISAYVEVDKLHLQKEEGDFSRPVQSHLHQILPDRCKKFISRQRMTQTKSFRHPVAT